MRTSQNYQRCPAIISVSYVFSRRCPVRTYNQVTFGLGQPQSLGKLGRPCRVCVLHRQVSPRHLMLFPVHTFVPHASAISVAATIDTRRPFSRIQW
jgi:hypothetical protein